MIKTTTHVPIACLNLQSITNCVLLQASYYIFCCLSLLNTQYIELIGNMLQHSIIGVNDTKHLKNYWNNTDNKIERYSNVIQWTLFYSLIIWFFRLFKNMSGQLYFDWVVFEKEVPKVQEYFSSYHVLIHTEKLIFGPFHLMCHHKR